jgi:hypothetical protein
MEADISAMQSDLDDAMNAQRAAEERADRLQAEVNAWIKISKRTVIWYEFFPA